MNRTWEEWISRYAMCSFDFSLQNIFLIILFHILTIFMQKFGGMGADGMGGMDFSVRNTFS